MLCEPTCLLQKSLTWSNQQVGGSEEGVQVCVGAVFVWLIVQVEKLLHLQRGVGRDNHTMGVDE